MIKKYSIEDRNKLNILLKQYIEKYINRLEKNYPEYIAYIATTNLRLLFYADELFVPKNENESEIKKNAVEIFNTIFQNQSIVQTLADLNCYLYTLLPANYLDNIIKNLALSIYKIMVDKDSGKREKKKTAKCINRFFDKYDFGWILFYIKYIYIYEK